MCLPRYATGGDVTDHSVLIHDFYSRETSNPVHLILDTTLQKSALGIKVFLRWSSVYATLITCTVHVQVNVLSYLTVLAQESDLIFSHVSILVTVFTFAPGV